MGKVDISSKMVDNNSDMESDAESVVSSQRLTKRPSRAETQRKKVSTKVNPKAGVVYLGRVPTGFEEKEMKIFFGQFGDITRMRLSRSKKTGNSKGFAFLEFDCRDVATIVAETMQNYRMFGKTMQAKVVPAEHLHPETWKGCDKKFDMQGIKNRKIATIANASKYENTHETKHAGRVRREGKKLGKLAAMGIEYKFEGLGEQEKRTAQVKKAKAARFNLEKAAKEEREGAKKAAKKEKKAATKTTPSKKTKAATAAPTKKTAVAKVEKKKSSKKAAVVADKKVVKKVKKSKKA